MKGGEKNSLIQSKFSTNVYTIKRYTDDKYKLTWHKRAIRQSGVEDDNRYIPERLVDSDSHFEKLENNLSRTKSVIYELAICNKWDYFFTFTLDPQKYDRHNLKEFKSDLGQFIRNQRRITDCEYAYLLVPEQHEDGAWHMHGFLKGVDVDSIRLFNLDERLPHYIRNKLLEGQEVYEWVKYRNKFGFNDLEPIRNEDAAAKYVTKYITKDLERSVTAAHANMYYCSQGLNRAVEIKRGLLSANSVPLCDFENEFVGLKWLDASNIEPFLSQI